MNTEIITISENLELVKDVDKPDWYSLTEMWKRYAPRDEHGNPNPSMAPYKWRRLPQARRVISSIEKKLRTKVHIYSFGINGTYINSLEVAIKYYDYLVERKENEIGFIYFVECDNFIKIGHSTNFKRRLASLRAQNPKPIKVLKVIKGSLQEEKKLHQHFKEIQHQFEWFYKTDSLIKYIRSL